MYQSTKACGFEFETVYEEEKQREPQGEVHLLLQPRQHYRMYYRQEKARLQNPTEQACKVVQVLK